MNHFVFQQYTRLKVDWSTLRDQVGDTDDIILVCTADAAKKHRPDEGTCADIVHWEDFSVAGLERVVRERGGPTGRFATLDEEIVPVIGGLRDSLGLPGMTAADAARFTDKIQMKRAAAASGVNLPRHRELPAGRPEPSHASVTADLGSPVFVKPTVGGGSFGAARLDDAGAWERWCATRDPAVAYEVDEFLTGTLFHIDAVLRATAPPRFFAGEYSVPNADFFHGSVLGSRALAGDEPAFAPLMEAAIAVFGAMTPPPGVYHMELFRRPTGEWTFLEVAARPPGGMVTELYEAAYGINIQSEGIAAQWSDEAVPARLDGPLLPARCRPAIWGWVPPVSGTVQTVSEPAWSGADTSMYWRCRPGDVLSGPRLITDRVAGLVSTFTDFDAAQTALLSLRDGTCTLLTVSEGA